MDKIPSDMVDANTPTIGPKNAKLTVIEFFDYNCGYCKQVSGDVQHLLKDDKTIRFAFKELPILADTSELAARYALAANKQGKYLEFHNTVMDHQGPLNEEYLLATGKSLGLNTEQMKKDANTQDVKDILNKNLDLARQLGVRGTPFFIIGKEKVPGAIGYSNMKDIIATELGQPKPSAAAATPAAADSTAAAPAAADAGGDIQVGDPAAQAEIDKAKADTKAMIDDLKTQAEKLQKDSAEQQKKLEAQAKAQAAADKTKAAAAPADKSDGGDDSAQ
jgi:hypothetical protein